MRKFLITIIVLNSIIWFGLSSLAKAEDNDYSKAVVGSVIQSTVNGDKVDTEALMNYEMEKLVHSFSIEAISILQAYLPYILEGIAQDLRLKADKEYKCSLLKGSKIEDDCR